MTTSCATARQFEGAGGVDSIVACLRSGAHGLGTVTDCCRVLRAALAAGPAHARAVTDAGGIAAACELLADIDRATASATADGAAAAAAAAALRSPHLW